MLPLTDTTVDWVVPVALMLTPPADTTGMPMFTTPLMLPVEVVLAVTLMPPEVDVKVPALASKACSVVLPLLVAVMFQVPALKFPPP